MSTLDLIVLPVVGVTVYVILAHIRARLIELVYRWVTTALRDPQQTRIDQEVERELARLRERRPSR